MSFLDDFSRTSGHFDNCDAFGIRPQLADRCGFIPLGIMKTVLCFPPKRRNEIRPPFSLLTLSVLRSSQDTRLPRGWSHWIPEWGKENAGPRHHQIHSSPAHSMLSNSHTRRRLDELFTVLRLFFAIAVGYTFNCERWSVAGTRRTDTLGSTFLRFSRSFRPITPYNENMSERPNLSSSSSPAAYCGWMPSR